MTTASGVPNSTPHLVPLHGESASMYVEMVHTMALKIAHHLRSNRTAPATDTSRSQLEQRIDDVDLDAPPVDGSRLIEEIDSLYLDETVWFHHPDYLAHLNCPVDVNAVAAEAALAAVNTSVDTYDQSRVATLIERRIVSWLARRIGFDAGDGIFTSGGTQSNLQALFLAREAALEGLGGPGRFEAQSRLVVFTSEDSHFSVDKGVLVLGLPEHSVVKVSTSEAGRMDPADLEVHLERAKEEGRIPMAVSATAGTTDRGVVDPLDQIAEVCEAHGVWFHVDAAYGGGLLVSPTRSHLLRGVERARSVTVDLHKTYFQPVSSSVLVLRDATDFSRGTWHAEYLNPAEADEPNQVDKSLQTTRRFDALKMYATLRGTGVEALGRAVDTVIETAHEVHGCLRVHPELRLLSDSDLSTVLFRWQPEGISDAEADALVPRLRRHFQRSGRLLLAKTVLDGRPCLKITVLNPSVSSAHIMGRLDEVAEAAVKLHREENSAREDADPKRGVATTEGALSR